MSCLLGQVEESVPNVNVEGIYKASPASNLKESIPVSWSKIGQFLYLKFHPEFLP